MDHPIISADDHMDMMALPPELWTQRLPSRYAARAPHVVQGDEGPVWLIEDRVASPSGRKPGHLLQTLQHGFRPGRPDTRLEDMERDGVYAQVIYGPVGGLPVQDSDLRAACMLAYNDWAAEFNRHDPDRLIVLGMLPTTRVDLAIAELQRCEELGHRGAVLSAFGGGALFEDAWAPFWDAAEASGIVLHTHLSAGFHSLSPEPGSWQLPACIAVAPMQLDEILAALLLSGVLERRPGLRLVLGESGLGWLPYLLDRLDLQFEKFRDHGSGLRVRSRPSETFRRQVYVTYEQDGVGIDLLDRIGVENVMWASDYPHGDSTWPRSVEAIESSELSRRGPAALRKVVFENAAGLYGIQGPSGAR